uniref:Uncharacterized protein n=1 Tax=Rhizophora mucronata TaxID=61149 RepID=A0A2P2L949_RHIMU
MSCFANSVRLTSGCVILGDFAGEELLPVVLETLLPMVAVTEASSGRYLFLFLLNFIF